MQIRKLFAIAIMGLIAATSSAIDTLPLIQTKVMRDLQKAERFLNQGEFEKAAVYASLYSGDELTVRVDQTSLPIGYEAECRSALNDAMKMWEYESNGRVRFRLVESGPAMVRLKFTDSLYVGGSLAAGRATWSRNVVDWGFGQITREVSARVEVRWKGTDGQNHSPAAMRHTLAHELGHVIGLDDNPAGGIMGPLNAQNPETSLSSQEESALTGLLSASEDLFARAQVTARLKMQR